MRINIKTIFLGYRNLFNYHPSPPNDVEVYSVHSDDFKSISLFYKIIWPVKSAIGFVSWNNFVYNLTIRHLDDPANFRSIGPTSFAVHIQSCNENEYYVFLPFLLFLICKINYICRFLRKFCVQHNNWSLRWFCEFQLNRFSQLCCTFSKWHLKCALCISWCLKGPI